MSDLPIDEGFKRINRYFSVLEILKQKKAKFIVHQKILKHIVSQLLPVIVGEERYAINPVKYHTYAILPKKKQHYVIASRQVGKSTAILMATVALLCVADGHSVASCLCVFYVHSRTAAMRKISTFMNFFLAVPLIFRPALLFCKDCSIETSNEKNGKKLFVLASVLEKEIIPPIFTKVTVCDVYDRFVTL
jgi:hypothetical protein